LQLTRRGFVLAAGLALMGCADTESLVTRRAVRTPQLYPNETPELRALINKYADLYDVPRSLVHRVIQRESDYRASARNGRYMGLMQIDPRTAAGMGHTGGAEDLLDAETNLRYAVRYLRGAWLVSQGDQDAAIMWYARGYYYEAKRLGLLDETGLRT
jgi:soluble lytic murein transglycosylase-like protein